MDIRLTPLLTNEQIQHLTNHFKSHARPTPFYYLADQIILAIRFELSAEQKESLLASLNAYDRLIGRSSVFPKDGIAALKTAIIWRLKHELNIEDD